MITVRFDYQEDFRAMSDDAFESQTIAVTRTEREILLVALRHLRETERRRLFSKRQCSSLFEYCLKVLGYTENQAGPRISAMRLLQDCPEIEERIADGALSLTNVSMTRTMFRKEQKAGIKRTQAEKLEVLKLIENQTTAQTEIVLRKESKLSAIEQVDGEVQKIFVSNRLQAKLDRIRDIKSHAHPHLELSDLIEMMADLAIEKWDPLKKAERAVARIEKRSICDIPEATCTEDDAATAESPWLTRVEKTGQSRPRAIRAMNRHAVVLRDQAKCTNCGSSRLSELDHKHEFAKGGSHEVENLQVLCRSCNQRKAIEAYGISKMHQYLRAPRVSYVS